ncbi:MAG: DUF309 domain-containing protein [Gemmatimonadales bacterium]
MTHPPALRQFLELFNRGEYWESHEALEPAWQASRSEFYHGLILLASALVHWQRGNRHGLISQMAKALRALEPYAPVHAGIDVGRLVRLGRRMEVPFEIPWDQDDRTRPT